MSAGQRAAAAAASIGILSAFAIAVGLLLMAKLGGASGADLGAKAADQAFADATPLLCVAEAIKLLSAAAQLVLVHDIAGGPPRTRLLLASGVAGALLVAASGMLGFGAIFARSRDFGAFISGFGFLGMAATGLWVLALIRLRPVQLSRWQVIPGILFAAVSLSALFVPPAALISVVLGWFWWFGLAARLRQT